MKREVEYVQNGAVKLTRYSGLMTHDDILGLIRDRQPPEKNPTIRLFIADLSDAEFEDLDTEHIREVARQAAGVQRMQRDDRPTLIIAPDPLIRGLANMLAGYRADELQFVFPALDEALDWAQAYLSKPK